jgi:hypothetical protein
MLQDLIQLGDPIEHRGIVVTPLFPRRDPVAAYITLDEALPRGLRIAEIDASGSVPELAVENPLDARVLLYDGEELVGAKQNRILNVSVLVEARSKLPVPVSCVEQGRWSSVSPSFGAGRNISHGHLRRRKAQAQEAQPLAHGIAQQTVWGEVHARLRSMDVASETGASADLYRARTRDLEGLERAFPAEAGQCGAVLGLGPDLCLDLVSRPDAFARLWPKLRAGYLLDALGRLDSKPTSQDVVRSFVDAVGRAERTESPSAGLGQDVRLRGDGVIGSGLELDGEVLQLSGYTTPGDEPSLGRIVRPSQRR